jgi:hypothetical protein
MSRLGALLGDRVVCTGGGSGVGSADEIGENGENRTAEGKAEKQLRAKTI